MFEMHDKEQYRNFTNYEPIIKEIRFQLKSYIMKGKLKSLVIGVSGGIDSALCCALANPVCKELNIPLIGRSLPIMGNKSCEKSRALSVGELLCSDFKEIHTLNDTFLLFNPENIHEDDDFSRKIRLGNIKARLRMIYLYDLAQSSKGLVLSTDNLTELLLGFWTLHGDVGDYGMIQSLWKTEVYEMSEYLKDKEGFLVLKDCIEAIPTDGLGITDSDLDQIGSSSYSEVDIILQSYILRNERTFENHKVVKRYNSTHFKRDNPFNIRRSDLDIFRKD